MQWILQDFEDTRKLAEALDRQGCAHTWHRVVPFVGDLIPEPVVPDPGRTVMFGSYSLWRYAERHGYRPGVFMIRPFVGEEAWHPHLLNGADALFLMLRDIPGSLPDDGRAWFVRPVDDSKAEPGGVRSSGDIHDRAHKVLALDAADIPDGSLRHDTELMLTRPVRIMKEWRLWVVDDVVVTYSLYKEGRRVVYRAEIDDDALTFARRMVALNPDHARAFVMDVCHTADGLRLLETNCLNAAGFCAADLGKLVAAIEGMGTP